jgi:hypothetical protein
MSNKWATIYIVSFYRLWLWAFFLSYLVAQSLVFQASVQLLFFYLISTSSLGYFSKHTSQSKRNSIPSVWY